MRNERGGMLVQVVLMSAVLMAVVYAGFSSVQSTLRSTNTLATSASFQDLLLSIRQNLAITNECLSGIQSAADPGNPNGGLYQGNLVKHLLASPSNIVPVLIRRTDGSLIAQKEGPTVVLPMAAQRDFSLQEVSIGELKPSGRTRGDVGASFAQPAQQYSDFYSARLTIVAKRRSMFLGAEEMRGAIDLMFVVTPGASDPNPAFKSCTTRTTYLVPLGPPNLAKRKSGLECVDRGGVPVLREGADWYICRIPLSALQTCISLNDTVKADGSHPQGWTCEASISNGQVSYAY